MAIKNQLSKVTEARTQMIVWGVLILTTVGFGALKVWPMTQKWMELSDENKKIEKTINNLEDEIRQTDLNFDETKQTFDEVSAPFLTKEKQVFPETIDITNITKTLELFGLELAVLNSTTTAEFELNNLSFSKTKKAKKEAYATTPVSMTVVTTPKKLQTFVEFIQTSKLPDSFQIAKNSIETTTYKFLENNYLPIAHIESIKISEIKDSNMEKAQLSVSFFSQN